MGEKDNELIIAFFRVTNDEQNMREVYNRRVQQNEVIKLPSRFKSETMNHFIDDETLRIALLDPAIVDSYCN